MSSYIGNETLMRQYVYVSWVDLECRIGKLCAGKPGNQKSQLFKVEKWTKEKDKLAVSHKNKLTIMVF